MSGSSAGVRLMAQSATYMLGTVLMRGGNFLLIPVYTAFLTTTEYGAIGILKQLAQLLMILAMAGQGPALLKMGILDSPDSKHQATLTGSLFTYVGVAGLVLSSGVALLWPLLKPFLDDLPLWPIGIAALSAVMTMAMFEVGLASVRLRQQAAEYTKLNLQRWGFLLAGVGVFVVALGWGAHGLLIAISLSFLGGTVLAFRKLPTGSRIELNPEILKKSLIYGLPIVPHALSGILLQSADRVALAAGPGLAEVGRYTLAANLAAVVTVFAIGMHRAWTPFFLNQVRDEAVTGWDAVRRLSFFSIAAIGAVTIATAFSAPLLVGLASNADYASAIPVISILALAGFVQAYNLVASAVIFSKTSATRLIAFVSIPPAIINIGLNQHFVPQWGMMGAAYSTLCSTCLLALGGWILARRTRRVPFKFGKAVAVLFMVAGCVCVGQQLSWLVQVALLLAYVGGLLLLDFRDIMGAIQSLQRQLRERRNGVPPADPTDGDAP